MNKRKVLDSARKLAQKGAKQKALKEYEKLLAADPRDAKLLLEVGDAYRRWGQVEDAINQYTRVAAQFRQDGFDARAVAVYKQILNLDSKRYETFVSLGDLYQHMGLDSEAIGALQTAADGYHKEGDKPKALELLRKMAALDPSNTTSRMKVADLLKQEGLDGDAVTEYKEVAAELQRQGATESVPNVLERILEIEPDSVESLASLADCYLGLARADRAEPCALKLAELDGSSDAYERLCTVYKALGDEEKLADATRKLAKLYRDRGDEDQAREIMQRLPTEAVVETGGLGRDQSDVDEPVLSDDEVLDDDEFLLGDDDGDGDLELSLDTPSEPPVAAKADDHDAGAGASLPIPDGDPDQLFAEATVYLRYGKTEQAVASLKGILVQQPDHQQALEKLGEAMIEKGEEAGAVANWRRAAELAAAAGDASALDLLRDRIAAIDPAAAAELPSIEAPAAAAPAAEEDDDGFELDLELDVEAPATADADADDATDGFELDLDAGGEALGDAIDAAADDASSEDADDLDGGFELDLDTDDDLAAAMAEAAGTPASDDAADATGSAGDDGAEFEIDLDADDLGIDVEIDADAPADEIAADAGQGLEVSDGPSEDDGSFDLGTDELALDVDLEPPASDTSAIETPAASQSANAQSSSTAARIEEELEEAEFYLQQDLDAEAEAIYRRILEVAPGHPSALLRLGELAARKGRDPADLEQPAADATSAAEPAAASASEDEGLDLDLADGTLDFDLDDMSGQTEPLASETTDDTSADSSPSVDELGFGGETDDSTEVAMLDDDALAAPGETSNPLLSEEMADAALGGASLVEPDPLSEPSAPPQPPASEPVAEPIAAAASDDDSFDLAAELAGAFEEANAPEVGAHGDATETGEVLSKVDDGFESIFSDFKKGVSAALEEGDYETRYDLGIAYREMGLFEDAIAEFRVCLDSANRRLESLHMMGLSAFDLGRFPDAVSHFEQALATPELEENRKVGIYFDLGRAHQASGDLTRAEGVYCEVEALDAKFPGIRERLEAVRAGEGASPLELADASDGELENFGDLFSSDDEEEAEEAEAFESFDDVITDVEAGIVEAEEADLVGEAVMEAEPEPEPAAPDDGPPTDPGSSGRRKKKISFV